MQSRPNRSLLGLLTTIVVFTLFLAACGSGKTGDSGTVAESIKAAISSVPGVAEVEARYNVNTGMGSTLSVRIQADAGTAILEPVMTESLMAFAGATREIKELNPRMGISFQVTDVGQENTINPTAVGLPQRPTIPEIIDFANNGG